MMLDTHIISITHVSSIPTANATSCEHIGIYFNRDTVRSLRIHEIATDPAGATREVTDDFCMISATRQTPGIAGTFTPIPELVRSMNEGRQNPFAQVDLIRTKNLQRSNDIRFIVTMELSGGKTLADTTSPITLI